MLKPEQSAQQQTMAPMPFYADPNRFSTPVWQGDPTQGWTQGQFIQQIPAASQSTIEGYTQQYSNGIYQATYQQPPGFESNTFYAGAVQVLTRPSSDPNQTQLTTRPNGSYSHTPSPVPAQQQQNNQRGNISGQYQQEYATNNQNYVAPSTTPTGNVDSSQSGGLSRPSSVNSTANAPSNNQNFQTHTGNFTPITNSNFSPVSSTASNFVNSNMSTNSGNVMPGYPPVNSHPQLASHSYSGGYPGNKLSGTSNATESSHSDVGQHWSTNSDVTIWEQHVTQQTCNNESAKPSQSEIQQYTQSSSQQNHFQNKNDKTQYSSQQTENKRDDQQTLHNQMQDTTEPQFSQADRVNLNSRLKTMILNKQQQQTENKMDSQKIDENNTGHFLSHSHHRQPGNFLGDDGGIQIDQLARNANLQKYIDEKKGQRSYCVNQNAYLQNGFNKSNIVDYTDELAKSQSNNMCSSREDWLNSKAKFNKAYTISNVARQSHISQENLLQKESNLSKTKEKNRMPMQNNFELSNCKTKEKDTLQSLSRVNNTNKNSQILNYSPGSDKYKGAVGLEIPPCDCLPPHQALPEPGSYYTHLGCANSLPTLRKDLEDRTGVNGKALRIEKICYTGKEGKTPQGCPIAKWIIRRANYEEKFLVIVKQRPGHFCQSAIIVVCIVVWDGVMQGDADAIYSMLCEKLDKFGLPTNRRCATNEPRTCACQGLNPDTCGASFSFGCSWSMYYNGCKYARSKTVRKFRLSVKSEEDEVEERLQLLATHLTPLYKVLAPESFKNQCQYEEIASDCRLGLQPGRPFSGVTACLDFCAHAHKDSHNMNNGCTVVVTLTKHRELSKPLEEQLHVLPLYVIDNTDEFGSKKDQEEKVVNGSIEILRRYQCEVRMRNIPQSPCRRNGKKRKEDLHVNLKNAVKGKYMASSKGLANCNSQLNTPIKQLQSNHVSTTVLQHSGQSESDYVYNNNLYYNPTSEQFSNMGKRQSSLHSESAGIYCYNDKYENAQLSSDISESGVLKNFENNDIFENSVNSSFDTVLLQEQPYTALNLTYPFLQSDTVTHNSSTTANTNSHLYKSRNHNSPSTNVLHFHQNNALNMVNTTAREYKYSQLCDSTSTRNRISSTDKTNDNPSFCNTSARKILYENFLNGDIQNTNSDFIWPSSIKSENHLVNSFVTSTVHKSSNEFPNSLNYPKKEIEEVTENNMSYSPSKPLLTNRNIFNSCYSKTQNLPSFKYIKNSRNVQESSSDLYNSIPAEMKLNSSHVYVENPFDDTHTYSPQNTKHSDHPDHNYNYSNDSGWCSSPPKWLLPNAQSPNWCQSHFDWSPPEPSKAKVLGQITNVIDNSQCFHDTQVGGVAIALSHGSVLFECAKHELHATTALKNPNRKSPTRISLVFYQHRNLNKSKHGWEEHEEKMRLRKLDSANIVANSDMKNLELGSKIPINLPHERTTKEMMISVPTMTTISITTVFPMYPCMVTGPYQEGVKGA